MTTWKHNEATAAARRCVLDIASLADGSWAPLATSFAGKIQIRLGGVVWTAAGGTLTNTGFDGHWVYEALQSETNLTANEVELRIVDATYYAQTLVQINQGADVISIAANVITAASIATDAVTLIANGVLATVIDTTETLKQVIKGFRAVLLGNGSGIQSGLTPQVFKGEDGVTTVVSSVNTAGVRVNTVTP